MELGAYACTDWQGLSREFRGHGSIVRGSKVKVNSSKCYYFPHILVYAMIALLVLKFDICTCIT